MCIYKISHYFESFYCISYYIMNYIHISQNSALILKHSIFHIHSKIMTYVYSGTCKICRISFKTLIHLEITCNVNKKPYYISNC